MKSKWGLLFGGFVFFIMMSAGSAMASLGIGESAVGTWEWSGAGFSLEFSGDTLTPENANYTFGISPLVGAGSITLLSSGITSSILNVLPSASNPGVFSAYSGVNTIELGSEAKYKFWFNDGTNPTTSIYTALRSTDDTYLLTSLDEKMSVTVYSPTAAPSAVPIPGSALLLGSGLLGLLGIGCRKNRA